MHADQLHFVRVVKTFSMRVLIAVPIFIFLTIIQSAVISNLPLLQGTADIVMLVIIAWSLQEPVLAPWQWSIIGGAMVGFASALPLAIPIISYLSIASIAVLIRRRVWKFPVLIMLVLTFFGTLFHQGVSAITLSFLGTSLPLLDSLQQIIMPSLLLNILLAVPIYAIVRDFTFRIHREEVEI